MKETRFISQNKEKWQESESLLESEIKDPGKLGDLFTQVVDDLSYSRTYYPHRSVRVYLNKVARDYFSIIYSNQRGKKGRFRLFWMDEMPQVIIHCKTPLLISLIVFLFSMAIGVFSSVKDPQFTASILGPSYVAMTKENIDKGDPMAVYKQQHQVDMFLGITMNNLMVAFRTYVFGLFLSIGSLAILISNGIMVGCFQFFFIQKWLFLESALSIWLHGTLEISSIIIAGGAGITLGSGLAFPGTYSRLQAFQISAIRSLKLMVGITPIFVVAAIIESFLTRYTDTPDLVKAFLIFLSAAFIIGYFVIYPWMKSRRGFEVPIETARLQPSLVHQPDFHLIHNNSEILKDAFLSYRTHFNKLFPWIAGISFLTTLTDVLIGQRSEVVRYSGNWWTSFMEGLYYATKTPDLWFVLLNTIATTAIVYPTLRMIHQPSVSPKFIHLPILLQMLGVISLFYLFLFFLGGWGALLLTCTFLLLFLCAVVLMEENSHLLRAVKNTQNLASAAIGQVMGLQFTILLLTLSFLMILSAPLIYLYTTVLEWNFAQTDVWSNRVVNFVTIFIKVLAFYLILPLVASSAAFLYHTLKEIRTAGHLKKSIASIAIKYTKRNHS